MTNEATTLDCLKAQMEAAKEREEKLIDVADIMQLEFDNNLPEDSVQSVSFADNQIIFIMRKSAAVTIAKMEDVFWSAFVHDIEVSEQAISCTAQGKRFAMLWKDDIKVTCLLSF